MLNVGIVWGGKSTEHDISILTGLQAFHALDIEKYKVIPIYIDKKGDWWQGKNITEIELYRRNGAIKGQRVQLRPNSPYLYNEKGKRLFRLDVIVNCCHGGDGENGALQGVMELSGIAYTGANVLSSAIGMDKAMMKKVFLGAKLKIVPYEEIAKEEMSDSKKVIEKLIKKLGFPMIVKPCALGSSIGITVAKNEEELIFAVDGAFCYDNIIVVERALTNFVEVNCSYIYGESIEVSMVEKPVSATKVLSFYDKYIGDGTLKAENGLLEDEALAKKVQEKTVKIAKLLRAKGVARVDYLIEDGEIYVNEINTIPGSLSAHLWNISGKPFDILMNELIEIALLEKAKDYSLLMVYPSSVLSASSGKKKK